jgi:hypothetical protein
LIQAGADVDFMKNGKTLLMKFCGITYDMNSIQKSMNLEVIKFLIEHGADKNLATKKGETAFDLAEKHCNREEVLKVLEDTKPLEEFKVERHPASDYKRLAEKPPGKGKRNGKDSHSKVIIEDTSVSVG